MTRGSVSGEVEKMHPKARRARWPQTIRQRLHRVAVNPAVIAGRVMLKDKPDPVREAWGESSRLWMPPNREIEISVVMPAYNAGSGLRPAVERLIDVMTAEGIGFEVIVVDDGSTDDSIATLAGLPRQVRTVELPTNRGKGGALHAGFSRARGSWVGFVDSDGDIDPAHLVGYLKTGRATGADMVYADKKHRDSVSASSPFRKLVSLDLLPVRHRAVLPGRPRHPDRMQTHASRGPGRHPAPIARDPLRLRPRAVRRRFGRRLQYGRRSARRASGPDVGIDGEPGGHPSDTPGRPRRPRPSALDPHVPGRDPAGGTGLRQAHGHRAAAIQRGFPCPARFTGTDRIGPRPPTGILTAQSHSVVGDSCQQTAAVVARDCD